MQLAQLAGIAEVAKQRDVAIQYSKAALAEDPFSATLNLDLAFRLAYRKHAYHEAETFLRAAERAELSVFEKIFATRCRGLIALGKEDWAMAKQCLESAAADFTARLNQHLIFGNLMLTRAMLCIVEGALGNLTVARTHFGAAEAYLVAIQETELLERCRAIVGQAPSMKGLRA